MLRIFRIILYLILINVYITNNLSNASFISFLKNIFSNKNTNEEHVTDKNDKLAELKIPVNSYILKQIKEINNIDIENKEKSKIKDDNFDIIQIQQQKILGQFGDYHCNIQAFYKSIINVKQIISVISFYNTISKQKDDFHQLIIELNDILNEYCEIISELYKSFNRMLDTINLIKLVFKDNEGIISKLSQMDNTVILSDNEIKDIVNQYVHQLDILLNEDTIKYYNNILSEFNIKIRFKKDILPSQLLFILFNIIKEEVLKQNNELHKTYISYKNKVTIINQKIESIDTYMKDNIQSNNNNDNTIDNKKDPNKALFIYIKTNINEQNRINRDIIDEVDRITNFSQGTVEILKVFTKYTHDERILSLIQRKKEERANKIKNKFKDTNNIGNRTNDANYANDDNHTDDASHTNDNNRTDEANHVNNNSNGSNVKNNKSKKYIINNNKYNNKGDSTLKNNSDMKKNNKNSKSISTTSSSSIKNSKNISTKNNSNNVKNGSNDNNQIIRMT